MTQGNAANPLNLGQINGAGDLNANFRDIWLSEVLKAYHIQCVSLGRKLKKTITGGKSEIFPCSGLATAAYHTKGAEVLGSNAVVGQRQISVDGILYSDSFFDEEDLAKVNWDAMGIFTAEQGLKLAAIEDANTIRTMILGARAASLLPGTTPGGYRYIDANLGTTASGVVAFLESASVTLDNNGIPDAGRFAYMSPGLLSLLRQDPNHQVMNQLWGGKGSVATGSVPEVAGIELVKTARAFQKDVSTAAAITASYNAAAVAEIAPAYMADFSKAVAVVGTMVSVGQCELIGLRTFVEYQQRRFGHLAVTSCDYGLGYLRPEATVEGATA